MSKDDFRQVLHDKIAGLFIELAASESRVAMMAGWLRTRLHPTIRELTELYEKIRQEPKK